MSAVTVELPLDTERKLRGKAAERGQSLELYLQALAECDATGLNASAPESARLLDALLVPVQRAFAESGMSDTQLADLVEVVREEVWQEKQSRQS